MYPRYISYMPGTAAMGGTPAGYQYAVMVPGTAASACGSVAPFQLLSPSLPTNYGFAGNPMLSATALASLAQQQQLQMQAQLAAVAAQSQQALAMLGGIGVAPDSSNTTQQHTIVREPVLYRNVTTNSNISTTHTVSQALTVNTAVSSTGDPPAGRLSNTSSDTSDYFSDTSVHVSGGGDSSQHTQSDSTMQMLAPPYRSIGDVTTVSYSSLSPRTVTLPASYSNMVGLASSRPVGAVDVQPTAPEMVVAAAAADVVALGCLSAQQGSAAPGCGVVVPSGWTRLVNRMEATVVYISPSTVRLHSMEEVRNYLREEGTCKCGLRCPLEPEKAFNFDPVAASIRLQQEDGDEEQVHGTCQYHHRFQRPMEKESSPAVSTATGSQQTLKRGLQEDSATEDESASKRSKLDANEGPQKEPQTTESKEPVKDESKEADDDMDLCAEEVETTQEQKQQEGKQVEKSSAGQDEHEEAPVTSEHSSGQCTQVVEGEGQPTSLPSSSVTIETAPSQVPTAAPLASSSGLTWLPSSPAVNPAWMPGYSYYPYQMNWMDYTQAAAGQPLCLTSPYASQYATALLLQAQQQQQQYLSGLMAQGSLVFAPTSMAAPVIASQQQLPETSSSQSPKSA